MTLTVQQIKNTDKINNSNVVNSVKTTQTEVFESKLLGINGEIEDTKQGARGDCWLLSSINALRDTKWGKKLIKDAIKPDGMGGAIIELKGSVCSQKNFHIPVEEIEKAKQGVRYSSGDDDMIAIELALEKYLKMNSSHYGRDNKEDILEGGLGEYSVYEIISGDKNYHFYLNGDKEIEDVIKEIELHPGEYCVTVGFADSKKGMEDKHSYQLKKMITDMKGQKYAVLVNPWDSSKEEKILYDDFVENIQTLRVIENPDAVPNKKLLSAAEKRQIKMNMYTKAHEILNIVVAGNEEEIKHLFANTDPEELYGAMNKNNLNLMDTLIRTIDLKKSGWGNGKAKKELISPIVDVVIAKARAVGVDSKKIEETSKACYKELDAIFYTDEKAIIAALHSLAFEIDAKEGKGSDIN